MIPNGETEIYGIIGNPVKHSFSPAMHTKAFEAIGKNAVYLPFHTEPDKLKETLDAMHLLGVKGFNVTVPYKEAIIEYLDQKNIYTMAKVIGTVNTVKRTETGWEATTTDGGGFLRSLEETNWELKGKKICILGAGGSAKAIAYQLAELRLFDSITILNRTTQKAIALKDFIESDILDPKTQIRVTDSSLDLYDILINTTSLGMNPNDDLPASKELIERCDKVVDIIYNPQETKLLKTAKELKKPTLNGLGMLLYQGVTAFEFWIDLEVAPVEVMKKSLYSTLGITEES